MFIPPPCILFRLSLHVMSSFTYELVMFRNVPSFPSCVYGFIFHITSPHSSPGCIYSEIPLPVFILALHWAFFGITGFQLVSYLISYLIYRLYLSLCISLVYSNNLTNLTNIRVF